MRLVLDQGLPVSAASILRTAGWDVVHASEAGLNRATGHVRGLPVFFVHEPNPRPATHLPHRRPAQEP